MLSWSTLKVLVGVGGVIERVEAGVIVVAVGVEGGGDGIGKVWASVGLEEQVGQR